jgi:uncharacterized membrane protein
LTELDKGQQSEHDLSEPEGSGQADPSADSGEALVHQAFRFEFSGPVPHPQLLAQYNEALPNGADRIVKLTENQAAHRQAMESRSQIFTFVIAMVALAGGIALIALGYSAEGLVPLVAAIAGLGGLFVYREVRSRKTEKALLED